MRAVEALARGDVHIRAEEIVVSGGGIHIDGVVARAAVDNDVANFNLFAQFLLRVIEHSLNGLAAVERAHAAGDGRFVRAVA